MTASLEALHKKGRSRRMVTTNEQHEIPTAARAGAVHVVCGTRPDTGKHK